MLTHIHPQTHTHTHTHTRTHARTHTHAHAHTRTHTHTDTDTLRIMKYMKHIDYELLFCLFGLGIKYWSLFISVIV